MIVEKTEEMVKITEITKREIEEVAETRQRSYTVLEGSYNELLGRYAALQEERDGLLKKLTEVTVRHESQINEQISIVLSLREANKLTMKQLQE